MQLQPINASEQGSLSADAWQAFANAALIRDALTLKGADGADGLKLDGHTQEAVMLALDRLVELSRSIALRC